MLSEEDVKVFGLEYIKCLSGKFFLTFTYKSYFDALLCIAEHNFFFRPWTLPSALLLDHQLCYQEAVGFTKTRMLTLLVATPMGEEAPRLTGRVTGSFDYLQL